MTVAKELLILRKSFEGRNLFRVSPWQFLSELVLCFTMYSAGFIIYPESPVFGVILQTIAIITVVWSIHDIGHGAFFSSIQVNRWLSEALGLWVLGMPQMEYHFEIHRKHHSFTNILEKDLALDTGFIAWHPKQVNQRFKLLYPYQNLIWIFFVLPLTYPLLTLQCSLILIKKRMWFRFFLFSLRWVLFTIIFWNHLFLLFIPPLITGFILGMSASLNHFHLPIYTETKLRYPEKVFFTTQNINSKSFLSRWLTGGLNSHIEHHLFPRMPSRNLHRIAPDIEQLAKKHDLPYHSASFNSCLNNLWVKLKSSQDESSHKETVHEGI